MTELVIKIPSKSDICRAVEKFRATIETLNQDLDEARAYVSRIESSGGDPEEIAGARGSVREAEGRSAWARRCLEDLEHRARASA